MTRLFSCTVCMALTLVLPLPASAQQSVPTEPEGVWDGEMEMPPQFPAVSVTLSRQGEAWQGTFAVPAEGLMGLPMAGVVVTADSMILTITSSRIFRGTRHQDEVTGILFMHDMGDVTIPMRIYRRDSPGWRTFQAERERLQEQRAAALAELRPPPLELVTRGPGAGRTDSSALERLANAAEEATTTSLVLLHDGELVGEWHAGGESRRIEAMSATKSILNLAVGRLLYLGLLDSPDTPVHTFYPEWRDGPRSGITVRHLLDHTSGIESPMPTTPIYMSEDFVRFALDAELASEPGTVFNYNNSATNLLAGVIGRAAGRRMDIFLRDELFTPLGITDITWTLDPAGNPHGMAGLQIHASDLALVGQLVLQRGAWNGEHLVDADWIDVSTRPATGHNQRSGLLWWVQQRDGRTTRIEAQGYLGQYLVILPEQRLVGVRMIQNHPGYDGERDGFRAFADMLEALLPLQGGAR